MILGWTGLPGLSSWRELLETLEEGEDVRQSLDRLLASFVQDGDEDGNAGVHELELTRFFLGTLDLQRMPLVFVVDDYDVPAHPVPLSVMPAFQHFPDKTLLLSGPQDVEDVRFLHGSKDHGCPTL